MNCGQVRILKTIALLIPSYYPGIRIERLRKAIKNIGYSITMLGFEPAAT
jgi:hypothetical protein